MTEQKKSTKDTRTAEQKIKDKQAAFVRIVQPRVDKALKAISLVGNCATSNYLYTSEQAARIGMVLDKAVVSVQEKYAKKTTESTGFSL